MKKENAYLNWELEQAKQQFLMMVGLHGADSYKAAYARGYLAAVENMKEVWEKAHN